MKNLFVKPSFIALCLAVLSCPVFAASWQKQKAPLMTLWGENLTADNVWAEYPRPSMVRPSWMNLNGVWGYFKRNSVNYAYERSASSFRNRPFRFTYHLTDLLISHMFTIINQD